MPEADRYRPDDQRGVDALYRRVFGADAAALNRLRWHWQHERNPARPDHTPLIWVVREGPTIVGHYAAMPVRLAVRGREVDAAWGTDAMVAPERRRQGLGELLFRAWDRSVGASMGLGLSDSSQQLLRKLRWPEPQLVPCLVKPLTRRAFRRPTWPTGVNRLVSALVTLPLAKLVGRPGPLRADVAPVRRFGPEFTALWERLAPKFDLIVRRDASYLNWKYLEPPHVRYSVVALMRGERVDGYAAYRHAREARGRVTMVVDFLVDPADKAGLATLLRWIEAEARAADSDKIRCYATHAGFRRTMRRAGYFPAKSSLALTVRIRAIDLPAAFYEDVGGWHVTAGDADQDR